MQTSEQIVKQPSPSAVFSPVASISNDTSTLLRRSNSLLDSMPTFVDNRPQAIAMRKTYETMNNSPRMLQFKAYQKIANNKTQLPIQKKIDTSSNSIIQRREMDRKDIEGYNAAYETIEQGLKLNKTELADTLVISVGQSPQVFAKYLEKRNIVVTYMPISGLSGKTMKDFNELSRTEQENRNKFFQDYVGNNVKDKNTILTIDVGVSGSSNLAVYTQIKEYLKRNKMTQTVKMATISPFQNQDVSEINTAALKHEDNIFTQNPLDTTLRGIHRLMKVQYNSIDKDEKDFYKFNHTKIDKGEQAPKLDEEWEQKIDVILNNAISKYGEAPSAQKRKNPEREFRKHLLFTHEVNDWRNKQNDLLWQEAHPNLTAILKIAYYMAAFASGASMGSSTDSLNPKLWKYLKL
jgi:hypothetical protein